jgi:hypothetical protein
MANEIELPDRTGPSGHIAIRNEQITLAAYGDPGIYQVEHDPASHPGKALFVEIGVDANRYERMPFLCGQLTWACHEHGHDAYRGQYGLNRYLPLAFEEFSRYSLDIEELLKCEAASVDDIRTGRWRILSECQQITRH